MRIFQLSVLSLLFFAQLHAFDRIASMNVSETKGFFFSRIKQATIHLNVGTMILEYLDQTEEFTIEPNDINFNDNGSVTYSCSKDGITVQLMDYSDCRESCAQSRWTARVSYTPYFCDNDPVNSMELIGDPAY